jgi:type IX secretion system PorP/SprF family membrane protein
MMSRIILSTLVILFPLQIMGQMFPLSDHYIVNGLIINPAFAGSQDALSLTASFRDQWVGVKDAPQSFFMSAHAPVFNDRIGLGLILERNSIGIFKENNFYGNYAYRTELGRGKLAMGLGFGVTVSNMAWNDLIAADPDDEKLMNNASSAIMPNFSLGVYYYTERFYAGFSAPMFLSHELDRNTGRYKVANDFSGFNYFLTGGYEFPLTSGLSLLPSALIKYHPGNGLQIDYNARLEIKERIWLGLGYRSRAIMVAMLQCQMNYQISLVYSYDYSFGSVARYLTGSHEIGFNYIFRYSRKVDGPRQY